MPFERYEILLPLKYNDGTEVEAEKLQETRREEVWITASPIRLI